MRAHEPAPGVRRSSGTAWSRAPPRSPLLKGARSAACVRALPRAATSVRPTRAGAAVRTGVESRPMSQQPLGDAEYAPRDLWPCLLYTSDAADERSSVDLGGRRII